MAIRIEFIRRRAGGRVTVKPSHVDKLALTLGRATDNDVYLPDLSVGLHHALMTQDGGDRLTIEALADHRLRVNGALRRRADLVVGKEDDIRIGPYRLALGADAAGSDLILTVELVEPPTLPADSEDENAVFSLSGYGLDKRMAAWGLFLAIAALFLAIPIVLHDVEPRDTVAPAETFIEATQTKAHQSWLAGSLSSVHANLVGDCGACHEEPFQRVADSACLTCHTDLRDHAAPEILAIAAPSHFASPWMDPVRAQLNIPEGRCGSCHFEHNGPRGVTPASSGFCIDCHRDLDQRFDQTPLINVTNFHRLHPEFHPVVVQDASRALSEAPRISLVENPRENNGLIFPHDFHLNDQEVLRKFDTLPENARARYGDTFDCVDCHMLDAAGAAFAPIEMETACGDCHSLAFSAEEGGPVRSLPHGEPEAVRSTLEDFYIAQSSSLIIADENDVLSQPLSAQARAARARAREEALADALTNAAQMTRRVFLEDGACAKCHDVTLSDDPTDTPQIAPVKLTNLYLPKAVFSHDAHMTGNIGCAYCHAAHESSQSSDLLMPSITVCRDCHNDAPGATAVASDCLTCHIYHDTDHAPFMTPAAFETAMGGRRP